MLWVLWEEKNVCTSITCQCHRRFPPSLWLHSKGPIHKCTHTFLPRLPGGTKHDALNRGFRCLVGTPPDSLPLHVSSATGTSLLAWRSVSSMGHKESGADVCFGEPRVSWDIEEEVWRSVCIKSVRRSCGPLSRCPFF